MDFEKALMEEHSKRNAERLAAYIGSNQQRFKTLLAIFETGDYCITQRAAWVLGHLADSHPEVFKPHVAHLIQLLDKPLHAAIKRNVLRVFEVLEIPEEAMGILADKCFHYLRSMQEPIAVKAYSITILYRICLQAPELKNELIPMLQDLLPFGSPGIVVRCKKTLKLLERL